MLTKPKIDSNSHLTDPEALPFKNLSLRENSTEDESDDKYFLMVKNISQQHDQDILLDYLEGLFHRNEMKIKLKSKMMQFDDNSRLCFIFFWMDESSNFRFYF